MKDLHVESYDANEVEIKKQSLVKRAAAAGCAIILSLSLFNLTGCPKDPPEDEEEPPIVAGGAGAWYHSRTVDEFECTEYVFTNDELSKFEHK